jgi:heme oxygenase
MTSTAGRTGHDGLSTRVREATRVDHDAVQGKPYLTGLLTGRLPREAYTALVVQHFLVYEALEQAAIAMRDDPVAGVFVFPELTRLPALIADLEFLLGADWTAQVAALPATVHYCARLQEVAFTWPAGFVAHHYTRYLADLAGGQQVGAAVREAYGLAEHGARSLTFDGVVSEEFLVRYRGLLDAVPWDAAEQDRFLAEVAAAYRLNAALVDDLGRRFCR